MRKLILSLIVITGLMLIVLGSVSANTIESSTIVFEGTLTSDGNGKYSGVIPAVVDGGYDIYGKNGASAWFGNDPGDDLVWTEVVMSDHDGWPSWDPDTPDWYQYSLEFDGDTWAVRNHPGANETNPWSSAPETYPAKGVPMSGNMNWATMYASEDDVGYYIGDSEGEWSEIPGGAESKSGGAKTWDMDWSWGSEVVPLEHGGFLIDITNLGSGNYTVTLTPSTIISPRGGDYVGDSVLISWDGTFESASLAYRKGTCGSGTTGILEQRVSTTESYTWDTSDLDDGEYCIKLVDGKIYDEVEVVKDTTPPKIEFDKDVWFREVNHTIEITGNITDDRDIAWYNINFGDGIDFSVRIWEENMSLKFNKSHIYTEEGKYTIEIYARDEAGNVNSSSAMVVVSMEEPDWVIPLYVNKTNFMSIPLIPDDSSLNGVLGEIRTNIEKVWSYQYDLEEKRNVWKWAEPKTSGWNSERTLNEIKPLYGYIVFMKNNDVFYGKGHTWAIGSLPEIQLAPKGFNLVGIFGKSNKNETQSFHSLISSRGPLYTLVFDHNFKSLTEDLQPQKAYWLSMTNEPDSNLEPYTYTA